MPHEPSDLPAFVSLARLLRPQGRRGELLADLLTDMPEQFDGAGVYLVSPNAKAPALGAARVSIESHWMPTGRNAGRIVLKLAGCDSISDAERLTGFNVMVPAEERPELQQDTFYISELVGCTLFDHATPVGEVIDVEFATAPDGRTKLADAAPLLVVHLDGSAEDAEPVLVPFVRAQLLSIDTTARSIVMALPAGLVEATGAVSGSTGPVE